MAHHIENFLDAENLVDDFRSKPLVIFVPGILAQPEDEDLYSEALEAAPPGVVTALLHNESHGMFGDVLECVAGKLSGNLLGREGTCPEYPARVLRWLMARWEGPILVLAHSQGAILTHNALRGLYLHTPPHVRTFGGAAWGNPDTAVSKHYVLSNDPVGHLFGRGWCEWTRKIQAPGVFKHNFAYYLHTAQLEIEDWVGDLGRW